MQELSIQDGICKCTKKNPLQASIPMFGIIYFMRDFLVALALGFSATVLPSFAGVFEREIPAAFFSVFVSTKRDLEARPRVTIPSSSAISPGTDSRHSSTISNLRFFDKEFSTAVSVEATDPERN